MKLHTIMLLTITIFLHNISYACLKEKPACTLHCGQRRYYYNKPLPIDLTVEGHKVILHPFNDDAASQILADIKEKKYIRTNPHETAMATQTLIAIADQPPLLTANSTYYAMLLMGHIRVKSHQMIASNIKSDVQQDHNILAPINQIWPSPPKHIRPLPYALSHDSFINKKKSARLHPYQTDRKLRSHDATQHTTSNATSTEFLKSTPKKMRGRSPKYFNKSI